MKSFDVAPIEGFEPEIGILLATLNDVRRDWRLNLGDVKPDVVVWQARPDGHSIGSLIFHMIDSEAYWFETFVAKKSRPRGETKLLLSEEVRQYGGVWPIPPKEPLSWYYELQDRLHARSIQALASRSGSDLIQRKDFEVTVRWVIAHVAGHEAYHGGQAVLLDDLYRSTKKLRL